MNRNLNLLMTAVGVVGANSLVLGPVSASVGAALGRPAADVMLAAAGFGAVTALSALVLAPWIDRIGAARAIRLAFSALTMGLLLCGAAPGFGWLIAGQAIAGLASGVALPAAYALAAELAPPGRAAEALGRVLTGWTLAMVFGVTLSAVLADLVHWRAVFALAAMGAGGLALLRLPNRPGGPVTPPWSALPRPGVARGLLAQAAMMTAFYGTYSFLGAHFEQIGVPTLWGALPVLAYGIGFGLAGRFDPWLDRHGYGGAGPWVFGAVALALLALAAGAGSLWTLVPAFFAWGLANHLGLGLLVGRMTWAGGAQKGAVLGLNTAVTYLAVVAGAAGFRPVFQAGGFALCAGVGAGLAALLAVEAISQRGSRPAAPV
ncbi:MFS transporter [uncultured Jannaschia sp.]|uniref:MFS transporter n=1 Tax=uncultured Jannaschia sp. TaxID=293347 RepID=UPI0026261924|nr:MFS transporter [uncultured Jannaschia sp.]